MQETQVQSLGQEDPLEKEMATHSSILVWKISCTEEPGGLQSMGSQRVGHDWATNTYLLTYAYVYPAHIFVLITIFLRNNQVVLPQTTFIFNKLILLFLFKYTFPSILSTLVNGITSHLIGQARKLRTILSSVTQSCSTLCDPMNCSMPGLPIHHQLPESTQTHVHLSPWCYPIISSSVIPFSSCL